MNHVWKGKTGSFTAKAMKKSHATRVHCGRQHQVVKGHDVEGPQRGLEIEDENGEQQQTAAGEVDGQEFPRGRESPRAAVAGDQQEHGDGLHLPEEEEQQVVERDEDAVDAGLQHQQQGQVFLWLLAHPAGRQNGEEEQERAHEQERHADTVDAQVVAGADGGEPGTRLLVGVGPALVAEAVPHEDGEGDHKRGCADAKRPDPLTLQLGA